MTYKELCTSIRLVASSLAQRGLKKGDVFAIYSPNIPEYAIIVHAVVMLGGVVTPINPLYTAEELAQQLSGTDAKNLITVEVFLDKARTAAKNASVKNLFVFGKAENAIPFASLLQSDGKVPEVTINQADDVAILPYSSGTTGLPKGVLLTHASLVSNMRQLDGVKDLRTIDRTDTLVGVLPFYHIYGMLVILNYGLCKGATVVTVPRFDLVQFLQILQNHQVTVAHLVPPIIAALVKYPDLDKYDLSKLKRIRSGAAPQWHSFKKKP